MKAIIFLSGFVMVLVHVWRYSHVKCRVHAKFSSLHFSVSISKFYSFVTDFLSVFFLENIAFNIACWNVFVLFIKCFQTFRTEKKYSFLFCRIQWLMIFCHNIALFSETKKFHVKKLWWSMKVAIECEKRNVYDFPVENDWRIIHDVAAECVKRVCLLS